MKKNDKNNAAHEATVKTVTTLAELNQLCQQKQKVEFDFAGKPCALEVRKLTPHEEARVNEIIESVTPAVIRGKTPDEDRLDLSNPDFIRRKNAAALKARSLALYLAVPAFAVEKPGLADLDIIRDFIQGQLTEPILHTLWQATRATSIELAELVNFT